MIHFPVAVVSLRCQRHVPRAQEPTRSSDVCVSIKDFRFAEQASLGLFPGELDVVVAKRKGFPQDGPLCFCHGLPTKRPLNNAGVLVENIDFPRSGPKSAGGSLRVGKVCRGHLSHDDRVERQREYGSLRHEWGTSARYEEFWRARQRKNIRIFMRPHSRLEVRLSALVPSRNGSLSAATIRFDATVAFAFPCAGVIQSPVSLVKGQISLMICANRAGASQ